MAFLGFQYRADENLALVVKFRDSLNPKHRKGV